MFEKITDFDGKQFLNLWGGFSCECFADGINTFVMFYIKDKEVLSLSGNDANDVLDFVLSEYYENENSTIEDGFSTWLIGHYDNVIPTFDGIEPKFHEGDWIVCKGLNTARIINVEDNKYEVEFIDGNKGFPHIDYIDRLFNLWTIKDAKDGDVLATDKGGVFIYAKVLYNKPYAYCGVDKFGVFKDNCLGNNWTNSVDNIHPATKEQRDKLFEKMHEAEYEWDAEKKELKKIVRKNTANQFKSKENKPRYDIGDVLCTTFNKGTEIEYILTTDDVPLSVLYKTFLKEWKRQNRIIEKQKKEIKKLKDKIDNYDLYNSRNI